MELPKRKPNRLKNYDYSTPGAYFITICTYNRKNLFWQNVGAVIDRPRDLYLSAYGKIVDSAIQNISLRYPCVSVDKYVIMPNHIHLILTINADNNGRAMHAPTISTVIQQTKGYITKQIGFKVWQKLFHDHIIRNKEEYLKFWEYTENNQLKWELDKFYCTEDFLGKD